jgi:hypothetical protein
MRNKKTRGEIQRFLPLVPTLIIYEERKVITN